MSDSLPGLTGAGEDIAPLNIIRTETVLSRFPIHRLVKKGDVQIEIKNQAAALSWEVTYNSKYGQPGPLAYKIDTLIVNRRIEEAGRPTPALIRLGSLRDICRELGNSEGGESTLSVRRALLQNASAFIDAKLVYHSADKTERSLEAAFTRYSVVFTGERLPDGKAADAVYLILNQPYIEVLNAAVLRPLDYDYMKALPPAAQRFYEIASYQIYAAILFKNERAKLRYSEYCMLSTATRYLDFDHVKKQMYKIHKSHLDSGYIAKVAYETTTDGDGQPDWFMYYVPGPNAAREYREFTGNVKRVGGRGTRQPLGPAAKPEPAPKKETGLLPFPEFGTDDIPHAQAPREQSPAAQAQSAATPEFLSLVKSLIAADLNRGDAERFARTVPGVARRQLEYLPFKTNLENPGGYLRSAIEGDFPAPKEYRAAMAKEERERKKRDEADSRSAQEAIQRAAEAAEALRVDEYIIRLEIEAPDAFAAFSAYVGRERHKAEARYAGMKGAIRAKMIPNFDTPAKRRELFAAWQSLPEEEQNSDVVRATKNSDVVRATSGEDTEHTDPVAVATLIQNSLGSVAGDGN